MKTQTIVKRLSAWALRCAAAATVLLAACGGGGGGDTTPPPPPAATAPDAPSGVTATAGNAQASVTFTAPSSNGGAAITAYTVVSSPAGGVDSQAASTSLTHLITGLSNGTAYTFTVKATNSVGPSVASAASNSVTPMAPVLVTAPGAPTIGMASAGNALISVAFSAPASNGGAAISSYTATCGAVSANGAASPIVVAGLSNGTAYTCTVKASNSIGPGAASAASNSATPMAPVLVTVPGAPTIGTATAGDAQISVAFTAPASNGGAAISGYTATCGAVSASGPASPIAVSGLSNGTAYTCTVKASNSVGAGAASAASNSATPTAVITAPLGALNDTGQSLCNNGSNLLLACTGAVTSDASAMPRQDGRFGRDAKAAAGSLSKIGAGAGGFDFTKVCMSGQAAGTGACAVTPPTPANQAAATANQWACTKDNYTGLTWSMQTSTDTWANATTTLPAAANAANRCGFNSGWRLPARRELLSIVHNGAFTPSIDTGYFTAIVSTFAAFYWSSDTDASLPSAAWTVGFNGGAFAPADKLSSVGIAVRLVHGPVRPADSFTDNGDGTVTDKVTGLMWDRCSQGQSGANCATGTAIGLDWLAALTAAVSANAANYKGHDDWRLPNKNELESLVDLSVGTRPTINLAAFPATPISGIYWSSTPYGGSTPGLAWYIFFDHPVGNVNTLSATLQVRLVRAGQSVDAFDRP